MSAFARRQPLPGLLSKAEEIPILIHPHSTGDPLLRPVSVHDRRRRAPGGRHRGRAARVRALEGVPLLVQAREPIQWHNNYLDNFLDPFDALSKSLYVLLLDFF